MDENDHGRKLAGRAVLQVQLVGWITLGWAVAWAVASVESPAFATGAGLMFVAAAIAFGLFANAVLRR